MNVVAFGGGVNSTAMIIEMNRRGIPIDLILFADPGAEQPHTYAHIEEFNEWLINHNLPKIVTVYATDKDGKRRTLEQDCIERCALPAIAYGFKTCSQHFKTQPQEKFCNNYEPCKKTWESGGKVDRYVGYDAGEERRMQNAIVYDMQNKKYTNHYPLIEWGIFREDCIEIIKSENLTVPGKSSCFFCPSMKPAEIRQLRSENPELLERALNIEKNAKGNLTSVKGLGRNWSWTNYIESLDSQISFCEVFRENDIPCGCYDG